MIKNIRHKGLKRLYEDDDPRGVTPEHVTKLRDILARLDVAHAVSQMVEGAALDVDYVDYH